MIFAGNVVIEEKPVFRTWISPQKKEMAAAEVLVTTSNQVLSSGGSLSNRHYTFRIDAFDPTVLHVLRNCWVRDIYYVEGSVQGKVSRQHHPYVVLRVNRIQTVKSQKQIKTWEKKLRDELVSKDTRDTQDALLRALVEKDAMISALAEQLEAMNKEIKPSLPSPQPLPAGFH